MAGNLVPDISDPYYASFRSFFAANHLEWEQTCAVEHRWHIPDSVLALELAPQTTAGAAGRQTGALSLNYYPFGAVLSEVGCWMRQVRWRAFGALIQDFGMTS